MLASFHFILPLPIFLQINSHSLLSLSAPNNYKNRQAHDTPVKEDAEQEHSILDLYSPSTGTPSTSSLNPVPETQNRYCNHTNFTHTKKTQHSTSPNSKLSGISASVSTRQLTHLCYFQVNVTSDLNGEQTVNQSVLPQALRLVGFVAQL